MVKKEPYQEEILNLLFFAIYEDTNTFVLTKLKVKVHIFDALYIRQFTDIMDVLLENNQNVEVSKTQIEIGYITRHELFCECTYTCCMQSVVLCHKILQEVYPVYFTCCC